MLMCLQIEGLSSTLAPILIELLQTNIPAGVEMTIKPVIDMFVSSVASLSAAVFFSLLFLKLSINLFHPFADKPTMDGFACNLALGFV